MKTIQFGITTQIVLVIKNWENGMTPIIFLNDSVVAVGWRSMEKLGLDSKSSTIRLK